MEEKKSPLLFNNKYIRLIGVVDEEIQLIHKILILIKLSTLSSLWELHFREVGQRYTSYHLCSQKD